MIVKEVGRYNPDTGKVEWEKVDNTPKETSFAVWGSLDFKAVGLPGQPHITSRNQYNDLLKQNGCEIVGNDPSAKPPKMK